MEPEASLPCSQRLVTGRLFWTSWIQFTTSHYVSLRSVLILCFHLCLGLPSGFFLSGFPTRTFYSFVMCSTHAVCPRLDHPNNFRWSVQVTKLLIMQSSPASCHSSLLGPNPLSTVDVHFCNRLLQQSTWTYLSHKYRVIICESTVVSGGMPSCDVARI
jgi:hypothetical protein